MTSALAKLAHTDEAKERIAAVPGVLSETVVNDGPDDDGQED
jgi:hypothetical protein